MRLKSRSYTPVAMTVFRVLPSSWRDGSRGSHSDISILYKFQIDISSNRREIKYKNIGTDTHTHSHTHRQTGWKQYLATPSGGEVIKLSSTPNNPTFDTVFRPKYSEIFAIRPNAKPNFGLRIENLIDEATINIETIRQNNHTRISTLANRIPNNYIPEI